MSRAFPLVMKLPQLKKRVKEAWESLNTFKDGVVLQPESFETVVKRFGDRRYKRTWVKALARLRSDWWHETCLDAWALITINLNFTPDRWDYEYRHEIMDEFLMHPDGLDLIRTGLEQIFSSDFSPQEQEEARHNGFYRLVEEREREHRGISLSTGFTRAISGASTAA